MFISNLFPIIKKNEHINSGLVSYDLMVKCGLIDKLSSGLYTWLPLGFRVIKKLENLIRVEMEKIGYQEMLMPVLQPSSYWKRTDRWSKFGNELFKVYNRNGQSFCLAPTHEEVVTDLVGKKKLSYKDLPLKLYQIQNKFRDEIRPRFGTVRSKEFIMKDAYSFHSDIKCLNRSYEEVYKAYTNIFNLLNLNFSVVLADPGNIGGSKSQEFHVLTNLGEDIIVYSSNKKYYSSIDLAERKNINDSIIENNIIKKSELIDTPDLKTVNDLFVKFNINKSDILKTILVKDDSNLIFALLVRGDHEINFKKVEKLTIINGHLHFLDDDEIFNILGCKSGFIGPIGLLGVTFIADYDVVNMFNFTCGSNIDNKHYINVNWDIDCLKPVNVFDIRFVVDNDISVLDSSPLFLKKGIEVGHIFELGDNYSIKMNSCYVDSKDVKKNFLMGCYGIGITRLIASIIEQSNDVDGIIWPISIAPYTSIVIPVHISDHSINEFSVNFYKMLIDKGLDVLYYDKEEHLSLIFKNVDLIGIPHRIVINKKTIVSGLFEYKNRYSNKIEHIDINCLMKILFSN